MHSKTRQIVAMQVGARNKQTAERLFFKLPEPLKKKPNTILTTSMCTTKRSPTGSTDEHYMFRTTQKNLILEVKEPFLTLMGIKNGSIRPIDCRRPDSNQHLIAKSRF